MNPSGFAPDPVTVALGSEVCWINSDPEARWPASNIHPTHEIYSDFDPKTPVRSGETWCFTFDKPGIWKYHDHLFPEFVGTVNVE
jgi:plastocyanin